MTTEGERPERDYSQFTPEELRGELISLFQILPSSVIVLKYDETLSHEDSYGWALVQRFESVIAHSFLTPGMQRIIRDEFYFSAYIAGARNYRTTRAYRFLDLDSNHMGIFDQEHAKEISRKVINSELKEALRANEWAKNDLGATKEANERFINPVVLARQEFIEKYEEEP